MAKSLNRFLKAECANWTGDSDEECLGFCTREGKIFRNPGKCWILEGKSCTYFKDCVLGPEDNKYPHLCFVKDPEFERRVRNQYKKLDYTVISADSRRCPDCQSALLPRQRYCIKCGNRRRRLSYRRSKSLMRNS